LPKIYCLLDEQKDRKPCTLFIYTNQRPSQILKIILITFLWDKIINHELINSSLVLQVIHLYKETLETKHASTDNFRYVTEVTEKQSRTTISEL